MRVPALASAVADSVDAGREGAAARLRGGRPRRQETDRAARVDRQGSRGRGRGRQLVMLDDHGRQSEGELTRTRDEVETTFKDIYVVRREEGYVGR